jgi:hypothetical protein
MMENRKDELNNEQNQKKPRCTLGLAEFSVFSMHFNGINDFILFQLEM